MITIDSVPYDIPFKMLKRHGNKLYKAGERTNDGNFQGELIGVYFNYDLEFGQSLNNVGVYNALWTKLNEAVIFHDVIIPNENGDASFEAYFGDTADDEVKQDGVTSYFRNLTVSIIQRGPSLVPND
jgi:hypothetical protein